jgi:hypothetical protein
MIWQDLVISGAGFVFGAALIPQVWRGFVKKEGAISPWTSVPTFIALYAMTVAYITLDLFLSTFVLFVTATLWLLLFLQWLLYR